MYCTRYCKEHKSVMDVLIDPDTCFFKEIYYTDNTYKLYKDELHNCSCNQFQYICTEWSKWKEDSINIGVNDGNETGTEKTMRLLLS